MLGGGANPLVYLAALLGPVMTWIGGNKMGIFMHKPRAEDLEFVAGLFEAKKVTPVIDRTFPLNAVSDKTGRQDFEIDDRQGRRPIALLVCRSTQGGLAT